MDLPDPNSGNKPLKAACARIATEEAFAPAAIEFTQDFMGVDRVLYQPTPV